MTKTGPDTSSKHLFTDYFATLEDPRRTIKGNFLYPLEELLFLTISATICGWDDWEDIIYFGNTKIDWFRKFYPYKHGIPSHDVLNKVFNLLDTNMFNYCFMNWVSSIAKDSEGSVIAIDGKTICGKASDLGSSKLHIVSAFCAQNLLSMAQVRVNDKSNEITAIPELLDLISIKGHIITIDAMGCQKDIAKKIIAKEADYILMLKGNQPALKEQVEKVFKIQKSENTHIEDDFGHGRIEKRTCEVITRLDFLDDKEEWKNLTSIIKLTSERTIKKTGEYSTETRYYISSLTGDAKLLNNSIRSHWAIENSLHWCLDVIMGEDGQLNFAGNAAENMNMIKKMVLNMVAKETSVKKSKAKKMKQALLNDSYRELLLNL